MWIVPCEGSLGSTRAAGIGGWRPAKVFLAYLSRRVANGEEVEDLYSTQGNQRQIECEIRTKKRRSAVRALRFRVERFVASIT